MDGVVGVRGRGQEVEFVKDSDFRLTRVLLNVNEEALVLKPIWEMM